MSLKVRFNPIVTRVEGINRDLVETIKYRFSIPLTEDKFTNFTAKSDIPLDGISGSYFLVREEKNSIELPTGLLVKLVKYLKLIKADFSLIKSIPIANIERKPFIQVRDNQVEVIEACLKHKRGLIKAPTGFGKTRCIAEIINQFTKDTYRLIVVSSVTLLYQMQKDISSYLGISLNEIGLIGDGNFNPMPLAIALPDTLVSKLYQWDTTAKDYLRKVQVLIQDEVHTSANATSLHISDYLESTEYRLGFSATPFIDLYILLEAIYGPMIIQFSEKDMMALGVSMSPKITFHLVKDKVPLSPALENFKFEKFEGKEMKIYNQLYDQVICKNTSRNTMGANLIERRLNEGRTVLVLVKKVATSGSIVNHAAIIQSLLRERGIEFDILHGKSTNKEELLESLGDGRIRGLIASVGSLSVGVSIPAISSIVLLCAGSQDGEFIQRVGRSLRLKEGKLEPTIDDFTDIQSVFIKQSRTREQCAVEIYGKENVFRSQ